MSVCRGLETTMYHIPNSQQLNYPLLNYQLLQLRHRLRLPQANATLLCGHRILSPHY